MRQMFLRILANAFLFGKNKWNAKACVIKSNLFVNNDAFQKHSEALKEWMIHWKGGRTMSAKIKSNVVTDWRLLSRLRWWHTRNARWGGKSYTCQRQYEDKTMKEGRSQHYVCHFLFVQTSIGVTDTSCSQSLYIMQTSTWTSWYTSQVTFSRAIKMYRFYFVMRTHGTLTQYCHGRAVANDHNCSWHFISPTCRTGEVGTTR